MFSSAYLFARSLTYMKEFILRVSPVPIVEYMTISNEFLLSKIHSEKILKMPHY